jgi:hypothetical protein
MEVCPYMRRNGFMLVGLASAAVALAGSPGYLPKVGPVALHFRTTVSHSASQRAAALPPLDPPPPPASNAGETNAIPPDGPTPDYGAATNSTGSALMEVPPVILELAASSATNTNAPAPLIGAADTNGVISPQIFLRYFTPRPPGGRPGAGTEAIIVPPTDFSPAQPAAAVPASRATYSQPE